LTGEREREREDIIGAYKSKELGQLDDSTHVIGLHFQIDADTRWLPLLNPWL